MSELRAGRAFDDIEDPRLVAALEEYLSAVEAGRPPSREAFVAEHAEVGKALAACLDGIAVLGAGGARPDGGIDLQQPLGDYQILREVGRGGMGVVYEAVQVALGRRVALKVLPFAATMDPRQLQRFHNEARAAASLQHPNIVQVFAVGCERAVHFYAMQYIDGPTLAEVIAARRSGGVAHPLPAAPDADTAPVAAADTKVGPPDAAYYRRAAEWGVQAAEALEHAHRTGIVHRDVKPANLMIDGHGKLYVTDFGLARLGADAGLTMTGDVVGTLRYMAPEQALAKHGLVDHRADVYALGATVYELLALRPAVDGKDREEVLRRIAFEEPPALRTLVRGVPEEFETIVGKAMAKAPEERYATAQEFADDLRRFLLDRPILARPPSLGTRLLKWGRRHQLGVLTGVVGLAVLVVALSISAVLLWQERGRTREALGQAEEQQRLAEQNAEEARRAWHVAQLKLAQQAWDNGDVLLARDTLAKCRPQPGQKDLRDFAWRHLWYRYGLAPENPVILRGHVEDVYAVAFAPDGCTVATAGKDHTARLWDVATGRQLCRFEGHGWDVNGVAFSPDGKTLATASTDRTVRLWDVATGKARHKLEGHTEEAVGVVFTPDGKSLISADRRAQVKVWDASTGLERARFAHGHKDNLEGIALSPDGTTLATAARDRVIKLWDLAAKQRKLECRSANRLHAVAFSPDGRALAAGTMNSSAVGQVEVWDTTTGARKATHRADHAGVEAVAFSRDGRLVAAGWEGVIHVLDVATWKLERAYRLQGRPNRVWGLAFSRDGLLAATRRDGTVALWRPVPRGYLRLDASHGCFGPLAFSPDGRELATSGGKAACRWDVPSGRTLHTDSHSPGSYGCSITYSPDGKKLAVAGNHTTQVWERRTGTEYRLPLPGVPFRDLAFSPDGNSIFALCSRPASKDPSVIRRWDIASGKPLPTPVALGGEMSKWKATPDGVMCAMQRGEVVHCLRWFEKAGPTISLGEDEDLLAVSPDGTALATSNWRSRAIHVHDAVSARKRVSFLGHKSLPIQAVFSSDGNTLATGSTIGELKVWDVVTGQELLALDLVPGEVWGLAFSHDGTMLAASGAVSGGGYTTVYLAPPASDLEE